MHTFEPLIQWINAENINRIETEIRRVFKPLPHELEAFSEHLVDRFLCTETEQQDQLLDDLIVRHGLLIDDIIELQNTRDRGFIEHLHRLRVNPRLSAFARAVMRRLIVVRSW